MRSFDIPAYFRSPIISAVKAARRSEARRRDFAPTELDFGSVRFLIARHFGFCFGVENAIEIAYRTLEQNPDRRVFLLSEMIHNPVVNDDLVQRGVRFITSSRGDQVVPWEDVSSDDIVIVPAFGTTVEIQEMLAARGIDPYRYDTTCPFVEKVWNRTATLGESGATVVVHGSRLHEETRATFSHSRRNAPTVVVQNMGEAESLAGIIEGLVPLDRFSEMFGGQCSEGFDPGNDLRLIGVVNQTTMLASETQAIAERLRRAMVRRYGVHEVAEHFIDTRDTLCYATNENQSAVVALAGTGADLALVVGGYNSSNTSHLVELCSASMPTYFVKGAEEIEEDRIHHFDLKRRERICTSGWLPDAPATIAVASGASCPDAVVDEVIARILSYFPDALPIERVLAVLGAAE